MRVLRAAGLGALIGGATAATLTYLPRVLAGDGYDEAIDALAAFGMVLVPLGAGTGALVAAVRGEADGHAPTRRIAAAFCYLVLLLVLWYLWAVLTGAPGPL